MILDEELGQDTRPIKSPGPCSPGNQKNDQKKRREETRRERNPNNDFNIKAFYKGILHYVLQEKIRNTLQYVNTRKEMQVLEEQAEEGRKHFSGK